MIKAQNLRKKYKKQIAVDNISFKVETGKVTGFLGPNGAGKSTTMRLMLGLDNGSGHTTYDGRNLTDYDQPSKIVGLLLEAKAFHPTRSARNHLKILAALLATLRHYLKVARRASESAGDAIIFQMGMAVSASPFK